MNINFYPLFSRSVAIGLWCTVLLPSALLAQSCPGLGSVTLNVVAAPTPTLSAPAQLCPDANGTVSVNQTYPSYAWNTGLSGQSTPITGPGQYVVTVTNATGCTGTASVTVAASPPVSPIISQNPYACNGSITLNAGPGYASYSWSGGGSGQTATFNTSGQYSVTVTNAQGCTGSADFDVDIPAPPVVDISGNLVICTGTNTVLSATPGFSFYSWNTGPHTANLTVSTAGNYTVTVTDAFGCTDTQTATVTSSPSPVPVVANATLCVGGTTTLSVSNAPFAGYNWSTGSTGSSTSVFSPGGYTVTVTAANGCTGTTSANVTSLPSPTPTISQAAYACNGQLVLSTPIGFPSYAWSNSANTSTTTVNVAGTYTVTVTNAQGCTGTDSFFADIPAPPVVSITGNNSLCTGGSTTLAATAGFSNYAWTGGQSGSSLTITGGGLYVVTVTDGFGCTATNSFNVNSLPSPQPVITGPATVCSGTTVTFNTSVAFPNYNWSTGENTASIVAATAGIYTVTVTAGNGCTGTDTQALATTPSPSPAITPTPYACDNQLILNAGAGFSTYAWSNGGGAASTTITTAGQYLVTVTNAEGCTGTDTYFADIPAPPLVGITSSGLFCAGGGTTLSATAGFNNYAWTGGLTTPDITVTTGGQYTVTVTDAFGCTSTSSVGVSALNVPVPNISGPAQICATGSATFSVPGAYAAYAWSTSANTPTITVNTANTYTVTVTAANGCTATDSQTLTVSNTLQPQITQLPYACNNQITLDAGTGFNTYTWESGQSTQSITVNANGDYSVTVSDAGGCTGTAVVSTSIPPPLVVGITGSQNICAGSTTTLNATGGSATYLWSTGEVGASISVPSGNYGITATDANGCTATDNFLLTNIPQPQPAITGPSIICINSSGALGLGAAFNQYTWSTGDVTATITVNAAGTYGVTVTDANGCTGSDTQDVTVATALSPVVTPLPYACTGAVTLDAGTGFATYAWSGGGNTATVQVTATGAYTVTVTDATGCTGTATASVTVPAVPQVAITGASSFCQNTSTTLDATAGFVNYNWSNGATTSGITANQSGIFTVTVTDNLGCTATESLTVTAQPLPQPQITGMTAVCAGSNATFTTGQSFAGYNWSDGTSGASITASAAGVYAVTVTDANGCTGAGDITLTVNANPVPAINENAYACDGQITLNADPGFDSYAWAGPGGFSANGQQAATTVSGSYSLVVTDANGCTGLAGQDVIVPTVTQVSLSGPAQFCTGADAALTASAGFTTYAWSSGPSSGTISVNTAGSYTVTATDALGCTSTATATLSNFPLPAPVIAGPQSVCPGSSATLSVSGNFSAYAWSSGATTASFTGQPPFTATVTVTDANGCTATTSATVGVSNQLAPNIVQLPYACDGQLTLDAGAGFPSYLWSNTAVTPTVQVTQSGTYTVTVSDGNGCSGTATIQVNVPVIPTLSVTGTPEICPGQSAALTASGGFDTYVWSDGQTGAGISVNQINAYTVTATDGNGCSLTATLTVAAAPGLTPVIDGATSICPGSSAIFSVPGSYAGYSWSTGGSGASISVSQAGNYTVTVTDTDGCSGTAAVNLVISNTLSPIISPQPYHCDGQITLDAGSGYATYTWNNGANTQTVNALQSGVYVVTVTEAGGCSGTATVQVTLPTLPAVSITGNTAFCPGGNTLLTADAGFSTYAWNNGGNTPAITAGAAGNYTVTVTDGIGCTATAAATVQTWPAATVSVAGGGPLCNGSSAALTTTGSTGSFVWSNGATGTPLTVTQPGSYGVTVTDPNGCSATASTLVTPGAPVTATVERQTCRPAEAGTETLTLVAASGCDSVVTIVTTYQPTTPGLALDLTPAIEAHAGQEITLQITGNFPIDSVAFTSPLALSCANCLNPTLTATVPATILVMAFNADGCVATDEIRIRISRQINIYVPTAFQPGSVDNGFFTVFSGPEVTAVRNFSVFDRWGNALFSRADLPTNDPTVGWDGRFRNQAMQPGVYVYYFEVFLTDGSRQVYSGDVTIVQ